MTAARFGRAKPPISLGMAIEIITGPGRKLKPLPKPTDLDIIKGFDLPPGTRGDFRLR